jgi:hypothetical protein
MKEGDMTTLSVNHPRRGINERRFPRKSFFHPISFYSKERVYSGNIRNIGSGGVFVQCLDAFPLGQTLTLTIPYAGNTKIAKRTGQVIWHNSDGFGFEFVPANA